MTLYDKLRKNKFKVCKQVEYGLVYDIGDFSCIADCINHIKHLRHGGLEGDYYINKIGEHYKSRVKI